jgi:hypothetical protein
MKVIEVAHRPRARGCFQLFALELRQELQARDPDVSLLLGLSVELKDPVKIVKLKKAVLLGFDVQEFGDFEHPIGLVRLGFLFIDKIRGLILRASFRSRLCRRHLGLF